MLLKDRATEEIEVNLYSVASMENYFLFIYVSKFEAADASVSAACK